MIKRLLHIALAALLGVSCVYPFDAELSEETRMALVVEGNIVIGGNSTVTLSTLRGVNQRNSSGTPSGEVFLEEENGAIYPGTMTSPGQYSIATKAIGPDSRYRLRVESGGKTYSTDWTELLSAPEIKTLKFFVDQNTVYARLSFDAGDDGYNYAAVSFQEIWYFHTDYLQMLSYNPENNSVAIIMYPNETFHYCWHKTRISNESYIDYSHLGGQVRDYVVTSFPRSSNRNHGDYSIKVIVRNLTEQEYLYRKNLENLSGTGTSLFSPEPGEVKSNIRCISDEETPVYGYVNISMTRSKTANVDGRYYSPGKLYSLMVLDPEEYFQFYSEGYVPVDLVFTESGTEPGWGPSFCINCVDAGGTLEKPQFD